MPPKKKGLHRHHIIPKYMGGTDDPENITYLTKQEHAEAHLKLYEEHGNYFDLLAYNYLTQNNSYETGFKQSPEHIKKRIENTDYKAISKKLKGRVSPTKGMTFAYKAKPKISEIQRGRPRSDETKRKISESLKGRVSPKRIENYCDGCGERYPPSKWKRHRKC